ncbi:uncharacterized protein BDZ99DRAFT_513428 [Mytilinidion resinicola]|uniref:Aminoglycoside phosphotransferase domain-containing protein n=1 Tax=Mytilinidion resinicola TaxID=574789 RepID=A0A6A6Z813_9PEZI|nr:uncharacterized protein BDZ99DRAFT_513428 [Mytilinidion resinicola]KAF2817176.1 hypothetical protein BDZ99DRAFT_513428 [Mytilinidion resinicola]
MAYVREHTSIPIPDVYTFDSDMRNNALGLEWIFMEKASGKQWRAARQHLKPAKARGVLKQLAGWAGHDDSVFMGPYDSTGDYASALLTAQMRDLSNPTLANASQPNVGTAATKTTAKVDDEKRQRYEGEYELKERGKMVVREITRQEKTPGNDLNKRFLELDMLVSDHTEVEYLAREVRDFVKAETEIYGAEPEENLTWEEYQQASKEEEETESRNDHTINENVDNAIQIGLEIFRLIPHVFRNERLGPDSTYLHHWDINDENLLVDRHGSVTALLDWEQLTTLPFAHKRERFQLPSLISRSPGEVDARTERTYALLFNNEMRKLDPEWRRETQVLVDKQVDARLNDQQELVLMIISRHHVREPDAAISTKAKLEKMPKYGKPAPIF